MRPATCSDRRGARGVTLPELLVVVAVISLAVTVSVPLISDVVRQARLKGAVDEFAAVLRAARWTAVNSNSTRTVTVRIHPDDSYAWTNLRGVEHDTGMPNGVCIASVVDGNDNDISDVRFHADGGTAGTSRIVLALTDPSDDGCVANPADRGGWVVDTNPLGFTRVRRIE